MLAPVLVRLDGIPGVAASRTEASGRWFLLELSPGADREAVLRGAAEVLGRGARLLSDGEASAQLAARPRGDLWLSAREVAGLSYAEGRILAVRIPAAVARSVPLPPEAVPALAEAVRAEVFAAVEAVHAEGGRKSGGWFFDAWPEIARRIAARVAPGLPSDVARAVAEALAGHFQR